MSHEQLKIFCLIFTDDKLKTYDWQSEWAAEWSKIINEKIKMDLEPKRAEIKQKLGITDVNIIEFEQEKLPEVLFHPVEPETSRSPGTLRAPKRSRSPGTLRATRRSRSPNSSKSRKILQSPRTKCHPRRMSTNSLECRQRAQCSGTLRPPRRMSTNTSDCRKRPQSPVTLRPPRRMSTNSSGYPKRSPSPRTLHPPRRMSTNSTKSRKRSQSPGMLRLPRRSTLPNPSESRKRSRSPQRPLVSTPQKPNLDRNHSSSLEQKTKTHLRLEQMLEQHKHSDDFLISWKDLLGILDIKDINQAKCEPVPLQIIKGPTDNSKKRFDQKEVSSVTCQGQPSAQTTTPLAVIAMLSVLTALENMLGSLGPKLINLLQTAIAMDRSKPNSSNGLLDDSSNCLLFETTREKLKGLLAADSVEANLQNVVRQTIKDMTELIHQANERKKNCFEQTALTQSVGKTLSPPQNTFNVESSHLPVTKAFSRNGTNDEAVTSKDSDIRILTESVKKMLPAPQISFYVESLHTPVTEDFDRDVTIDEAVTNDEAVTMEDSEMKISTQSDAKTLPSPQNSCYLESSHLSTTEDFDTDVTVGAVTLEDSEIKTLITKFTDLPEKNKRNFVSFLNGLKINDADRVQRLKNDICKDQIPAETTLLEWEKDMYCPGEVIYSGVTASPDKAHDKTTSIAYRVAKTSAGVKIRRRTREENDSGYNG